MTHQANEYILDNNTSIVNQLVGAIDPSGGVGVPAPLGSIYQLNDGITLGELYYKFGVNDIDWGIVPRINESYNTTANTVTTTTTAVINLNAIGTFTEISRSFFLMADGYVELNGSANLEMQYVVEFDSGFGFMPFLDFGSIKNIKQNVAGISRYPLTYAAMSFSLGQANYSFRTVATITAGDPGDAITVSTYFSVFSMSLAR